MKSTTPPHEFFVIDDFMSHALGDVGKFTYSRWFFQLVLSLRSGRNAALSDIAFCSPLRRDEVERVMKDAVEGLIYSWVFFERVFRYGSKRSGS